MQPALRKLTLSGLLLLGLVACSAEQTAAPGPDPLAVEQARLDANKQLLLDFFAFSGTLEERAERFLADEYIQHNPRFLRMDEITGESNSSAAWIAALREGASRQLQLTDNSIRRRDPVVLMAEGDLVTALYRGELEDPDNPERTYAAHVFQTVRIQNGKFVEHWDGMRLSEGWMESSTP